VDSQEFQAGRYQRIVVYQPPDTGMELDAAAIYGDIAADAADRAGRGQVLISLTAQDLRHAGVLMGRQGSGYESKVAVVGVYRDAAGPTPGSAA
jgi:hypothetical protein